ncbi:MAG: DUF4919 domain-containing protein [Fibrobacter sp.]|nr:DUF4919 domain-containing protein [Fibrobacter sp.]
MSYFKKICLSFAILMLVACAGNRGQSVSTEPKALPNGSPAYDDAAIDSSYYMKQLAVLRADSLKAIESTDWLKFRKEFLKCRLSQPDRFNTTALELVIKQARKSGDSAEELKVSQELLNIDFTNISAHYTFVTSPSTDENVKEFHKQVIKGLLNSISDSGQGNSTENAMYVINIGEEYDFLYFNGFKPIRQELIEENGHQYDRMITEGGDGNKYQFYFDVTDFFGHY